MPFQITPDLFVNLVHGLFIGGVVAVRYLWPLWILIIALWGLTRFLRAIGVFLGFAPARPAPKRVTRGRR